MAKEPYDASGLQSWVKGSENPAAPAGAQQVSAAGAGATRGDVAYDSSGLAQWVKQPDVGMVGASKSWFTGANQNDPSNGWSTPFTETFMRQYNERNEAGTLGSFFDAPDATGVVTYDHVSTEDPEKQYKYGDIYENGQKVGNLYEIYADDRDTANLMIAPWILDADEQKKVFADAKAEPVEGGLRMEKLETVLAEKRAWNDANLSKAYTAMAFEKGVVDREEALRQGWGDEAITAGGAGAGAALGAGIGSFFSPVGTAVGAAVGGSVGFLGAWANQDSLIEQAARAGEQVQMSSDRFGDGAGFATGVAEYSKFGMRLLSPTSNLVQGSVDAAGKSEIGDGTADFYRTDKAGERTVSKWVIGADVGSTIVDSLLQFASKPGLAMYSAAMGGVVAGQIGELGATGGNTFDPRRGEFDNIFYDTDPKTGERSFSPGDAAAGIAHIGIDAVQLGMARGMARRTDDMRAMFGGQDAAFGRAASLNALDAPAQQLAKWTPKWMGGQTDKAAAAAATGGEVRIGSYAYTLDDAGKAVSRRATLSILAPSEQLSGLSAKLIARRNIARTQGAVSTDDLFRAAKGLASGESRVVTGLVNAMGEAYEEGAQAALEPLSHDAKLNMSEIYMAAAYGFASGAGMGLGQLSQSPSQRRILEDQAALAHYTATRGEQLDPARMKSMTDDELRVLAASMNNVDRQVAQAAFEQTVEMMTANQVAGVAGLNKLLDAIRSAKDSDLANTSQRTDGSFVITPLEAVGRVDTSGNLAYGDIPAHGVASSAEQMWENLRNRIGGNDVVVERLREELARAADPEVQAKLTADLADAQLISQYGRRVLEMLRVDLDALGVETDPAKRAADVARINHQLQAWFDGTDDSFGPEVLTPETKLAVQRAVTYLVARDPHDSAGSYQALVPQISLQLTVSGANNVLQVSSGILKGIRGDHDGDKMRPQNQLWLDRDAFANARSGMGLIGAGSAVHVDPPKNEKYTVEAIADSLARASANPALAAEATAAMTNIGTAIKARYAGQGVDVALDRVLDRFYTAVRASTKDARAVLLEGLAAEAGNVVSSMGRGRLSNEWLWIDQVVRSNLQSFQDVWVAHNAVDVNGLGLDETDRATGLARSRTVTERIGRKAATAGQTMALMLSGDAPFRMFQKLHYGVENAAVLSGEVHEPGPLEDMAMFYEALGQNMTETELDRVRGIDEITGSALVALERMAMNTVEFTRAQAAAGAEVNGVPVRPLTKQEAVVTLANLGVQDFTYSPETQEYRPAGTISLAQMLLKISVQADARAKRDVIANDPSLQAKHARLLEMTKPGGGSKNSPINAEKAFVEVFGSQSLASLLGREAEVFGPQMTVEQYVRMYSAMSTVDRRNKRRELLNEPGYLGRKEERNVPYDLREVLDHQITPFRSVVDSIIAVGSGRISMVEEARKDNKPVGTPIGEYADRDASVSAAYRDGHAAVRRALEQQVKLSSKRGELTTELVERVFRENPDFARKAFDLIPNASASVVFDVRDGQVYVNNWFYQMFAEADSAKAEMIFWRATLLESWQAKGRGEEYSRLDRRMHQVMYRLAREGGPLQQKFFSELWRHDSVDSFIAWVNSTPGMRFNEAPLLAWYDDVNEFAPDRANGGWTTALAGAELREAIKTLRGAAENLHSSVAEERALAEADASYLRAIDRVERGGPLEEGDQEIYDRFVAAIDRAGELAVALGPQAMVFQSTANAWGFYGQAHTKGKNPAHVEALGMFDARRDAFGFVHNFSRVMGSLTALDIDAVGANLDMVAKDAGRAMDDFGNIVEWGKPTPKQLADMLRHPEQRAMARGILFPTVLERTEDGKLSEQMLVGKTLKELLDGRTFDDLFGAFGTGSLKQAEAFKYLSLVEATARQHGGHSAVQRAVNDIVIARLNNAKQTLTLEDVEAMVTEAYYEAALLLQDVGALAAREAVTPGATLMEETRASLKRQRLERRQRERLGSRASEDLSVDDALDLWVAEMDAQHANDLAALVAQDDGTNSVEIQARAARLAADHQVYRANLDNLRQLDEIAPVVDSYTLTGDPARDALVKTGIVAFVEANPDIRTRVPESLPIVMKLQHQLADPTRNGDLNLTPADWDTLSRSIIGLVLTDSAGPVGQGVSVRLFPDEKNLGDRRYYDKSFSYLIDPFLDPQSPIVQAAAKVHVQALRHSVMPDIEAIERRVSETVFDDRRLGPWTEEVVVWSTEANARIDSAAAAPAVSISGQSPKLEATVSAATERTYVLPPAGLESVVVLNINELQGSDFDQVGVRRPSGATSSVPLAMLNNRFATSVLMHGPGLPPEGVDLMAENRDLGRYFLGSADALVPGAPREISVERLRESLLASAARHGVSVTQVRVEANIYHPDDQPASPEYYNSLWFEGTAFRLDADKYGSLNEALWFALGSLSPEGQAAALDAAKTGKQAMQVIKAPTAADRAADEQGWEGDFAAMLRAKTQRIIDTDLGFGKLDIEMWNAVYKSVKMRHFVIHNGEVLTAEQVIAAQAGGALFPDAQLWTPSDKVLRTALGEQGDMGVGLILDEPLEFDGARLPKWRGDTTRMKQLFAEGLAGGRKELTETRIVHRGRQTTLSVRPMVSRKVRDQFAARRRRMMAEMHDGWGERVSNLQREGGFNMRANMDRAVSSARTGLRAENMAFAYAELGIPFVGPRDPNATLVSQQAIRDLEGMLESDDRRTGWIISNTAVPDPMKGQIKNVRMGMNGKNGQRILMGDVVSFELDGYADDFDAVSTELELLAETGATVILTDPSGGSNLRAEAGAYLRSLGYQRIVGSNHAFRPIEAASDYVVQAAREDTLMEVRRINSLGRMAVYNVVGLPMQEGGAFQNPRAANRASIKVVSDLIPTSNMGGFNLPERTAAADDQVDRVMRHLTTLDNPEAIETMRQWSNGKLEGREREEADKNFDAMWRRMIDRFSDNRLLPTYDEGFYIGEMLPLMDSAGRVVIYRHGYERPAMDLRDDMFDRNLPGMGPGGANVAVYLGGEERSATVHDGFPVRYPRRAGYGLTVELEVPLQNLGDKLQLQYDGTKYTVVPWPDAAQPGAPVLPEHTFFKNFDIALVSDLDTRLGKQGTDSMVNNHRNAFAYFGMDFWPDVTEFFFPGTKAKPEGQQLEAQQATQMLLRHFQNVAPKIDTAQVMALQDAATLTDAYLRMLDETSPQLANLGAQGGWLDRLNDDTIEAQIARNVLLYLSVSGTTYNEVMRTGSLDDNTAGRDAYSILMPSLFTRFFDKAPIGSPLRTEINRRLNAQLNRAGARPDEGYRLMENFDFITSAGGRQMTGILSFPEVHSSGDNPVTNGMAWREGDRQDISAHSAMVADQAIGGRTLSGKGLQKAQAFQDQVFGKGKTERLTADSLTDGGVWRMLSDVPAVDRSFRMWSAPLPAEVERQGLAYDAMVGFRKAIDTKGTNWSDKERAEYEAAKREILDRLNLPQKMHKMVDGWVRQHAGRPAGMMLDGVEIEPVTGRDAIAWTRDILENIGQGYSPVMGSYVPLLHVHDLKMIFRAQQAASRPWRMRLADTADASYATTWDDWVDGSLGSALASEGFDENSRVPFEVMYLLPTDGFMHTYQSATRDLTELPVSMSVLVTHQVLNVETNLMLDRVTNAEVEQETFSETSSIDPRTRRLLSDPILLDTTRAALKDLLGGQRIAGELASEAPPASAKARHEARLRKWRRDNGAPVPVRTSMKDFRANSVELKHHTSTTNALVRGLINLRVGMALFNPALYVSMPIEQGIRGSLDRATNILTGHASTGATANVLARAGASNYTPEQMKKLVELYRRLGSDPEFKGMVYGELNYTRPFEPGAISRLSKWLERFAVAGSRMQDPTWGMRGDTIARRYMESALWNIMRSGTLEAIGVDQVIDQMYRNPTFLRDNLPSAHRAGTNTVADIRSLKPTLISSMARYIYEPLSQNPHSPVVNMGANVVLRLPMLFAGYAGNVATTILGLQGLDQFTAAVLDGKKKGPNSMFGRIEALMRGDKFSPEDDAHFDMSSIIEGIDLSRAFLRGGLTHTGLFTFGMMAGGLGLSGEDEEARRRRKAAELQGAAHVLDPREVHNQFLNADALFLDWLPFGLDSMFYDPETGRAMADMHWMLKQFVTPIIGFEKFYQTGDFKYVKWGFAEALGSFPLLNSNTISDVFETQAVFEQQANDLAREGSDESLIKAAGVYVSIVGAYEKMLFENSFINALYVGTDELDRDPYSEVMRDSSGVIQRDALGFPRQSEELEPYIDPESGEKRTGYVSRPDNRANLAVLTENRFFLALASSIFSGGTDSVFLRKNMVPKIREMEKAPTSMAEAEALLLAAWYGGNALRQKDGDEQPMLTLDEASRIAKEEFEKNGVWWTDEKIAARANEILARTAGQPSVLGAVGGENVQAALMGDPVLLKLTNGEIELGNEQLADRYISYEMREQISKDWAKQIIAEGVAMGLSTEAATYRYKRLWMGPSDNPHVLGLQDLVWGKADQIEYADKASYYQLNTTYVTGPDGRPWATGQRREGAQGAGGWLNSVLGAAGLPPLRRLHGSGDMGIDNLRNSVDAVNGMNTGMRALMRMPAAPMTAVEMHEEMKKALAEARKEDFSRYAPEAKTTGGGYNGYKKYPWRDFGSGWKNFGGYKRRRYSSGGGYSSSGYPNFSRMYALPNSESPYGNTMQFINTSNPILRRGDVRRERVSSERGRLNQWQ